jgi:hypothetical protein
MTTGIEKRNELAIETKSVINRPKGIYEWQPRIREKIAQSTKSKRTRNDCQVQQKKK